MDFRELEYVIAIAEQQNISKAAERISIAQPCLSVFLKNLESRLGLKLFERINRKMTPTEAGKIYIETACQILTLKNQLQSTLNDMAQLRTGMLSIGSTAARTKYVMPYTVPQFKELYPGFRISLHDGTLDELEHKLRTGVLDIALYTVTERKEEFAYHRICMEEIVLAMASDNPCARHAELRQGLKRPWIDIKKLSEQTFLIPPEVWRVSRVGMRLLRENGMSPDIISVATVESSLAIANQGAGVCFCSDMMEKHFESARAPLFFSVGSPASVVEFVAVRRKSAPMTQPVRDYIRIVRSVFGDGSEA